MVNGTSAFIWVIVEKRVIFDLKTYLRISLEQNPERGFHCARFCAIGAMSPGSGATVFGQNAARIRTAQRQSSENYLWWKVNKVRDKSIYWIILMKDGFLSTKNSANERERIDGILAEETFSIDAQLSSVKQEILWASQPHFKRYSKCLSHLGRWIIICLDHFYRRIYF